MRRRRSLGGIAAAFAGLFLLAGVCQAQTPVDAVFNGPYKNFNGENGTCQTVTPTVRQTNNNGLSLTGSLACGAKAKVTVALTMVLSQTTITGVPTTSQTLGLSAFKLSTPLQITMTATATASGNLSPVDLRLSAGTSTGVSLCLPQPRGPSPLVYNCSPSVLDRDFSGQGPFKDYLFFQLQVVIDGDVYSFNLTPQFTEGAAPGGPDQISFIDDTFSPPLNQPFQAGQPTGPITVKVAYSLNSQPSAVAVFLASSRDNSKTVPVQQGNGIVSITLDSFGIPADAQIQEVVTRLSKSSATGETLTRDDARAYRVTFDPSKDAIQISQPVPAPGSSVPASPQDISATCLPLLKSGSTRYLALRIFDPDSPINASSMTPLKAR